MSNSSKCRKHFENVEFLWPLLAGPRRG
jgi:hypothetical protein